MFETFIEKKFNADHRFLIDTANDILSDYEAQGFTLTLRQLYYQFVARGLIENTLRSYKKLGKVVSDARLAGEIDWEAIEDRNREIDKHFVNASVPGILRKLPHYFAADMWENQENYFEVWVEKDALSSVVERACEDFRVPHLACKGYLSSSEAYRAAKRFEEAQRNGKSVSIIHLGDHDPSGLDMTRDNQERVSLMCWDEVWVDRIALNMDQVEQYNPPPNPAKVTDSRAREYMSMHGTKSWELDALEPSVIVQLIEDTIHPLIDHDQWAEDLQSEREKKNLLSGVSEHWEDIEQTIRENWENEPD